MRIGIAGWSIPKVHADAFPVQGSHLQRYAALFNAVEINSSFYRPHRRATYERWAASVPEGFRFSVKVPKAITHERRLAPSPDQLDRFLEEAGGLGSKLGPLLIQLPPSLAFEAATVSAFLRDLRARFAGELVCEPRHATWFMPGVEDLLAEHRVARVAADPEPAPGARQPGGWSGLVYVRLHGSPRMYYSAYPPATLDALAADLARHEAEGAATWCIFDNTAAFAATADALSLNGRLRKAADQPRR